MTSELRRFFLLLLPLATAAGCGPDASATIESPDEELFEVDDELTAAVTDDDLNGLWIPTVNGTVLTKDAVIESWSAVGIRLTLDGKSYQLTRSTDALSGTGAALTVNANASGVYDDTVTGTLDGATVSMRRDTYVKAPITLSFPGDRPFRQYLFEVIAPAAQQDRESFVIMHSWKMGDWLKTCELYKHGSWQRKYFKGTTYQEQTASFFNVVNAVDLQKINPRRMTKNYKFSTALKENLADPNLMGLAMSTFGMYFSTAAGRSLRMPITPDSMAYFITDRPVREERIGVVAMATPTHGPLASTFGRQLLDMGEMPAADSHVYAQTVMELMVKSDVRSAVGLSGVGRSALTDWYAVMAIEDYRGVAFGFPTLGWGYNMTNVQFYGLVVRALARPGQVDAAGNPVLAQVIVGSELRPGDPSYADVLNHGNDMQEYSDMARLKTLTTAYLRLKHPELIAAVESAYATVVPKVELDTRARNDIFHYVCAQLYDGRGRQVTLKGAAASPAVASVVALFDTLNAESAQLEAYLLSQGITKSNVAAPKSTGF